MAGQEYNALSDTGKKLVEMATDEILAEPSVVHASGLIVNRTPRAPQIDPATGLPVPVSRPFRDALKNLLASGVGALGPMFIDWAKANLPALLQSLLGSLTAGVATVGPGPAPQKSK
jgi:hypothetical protein